MLRGGNPQLTNEQLLNMYSNAYSNQNLAGIRGDLRTPSSSVVIVENVSPSEAYEALINWGESH